MRIGIADFIEFMNLFLVMLYLCAIGFFAWYATTYKEVTRILAIGFIVYFCGHIWIRGWTWTQWFFKTGSAWSEDYTQVTMFSIGLVITVIGLATIMQQIMGMVPRWLWYGHIIFCAFFSGFVTWYF